MGGCNSSIRNGAMLRFRQTQSVPQRHDYGHADANTNLHTNIDTYGHARIKTKVDVHTGCHTAADPHHCAQAQRVKERGEQGEVL